MKRLLLIFGLLAMTQAAHAGGPKWRYSDPKLNDEVANIYHDLRSIDTDIDDPLTLGGLTVSTITVTSSTTIYGTRTNDSAPAGAVGEYISASAEQQNVPTSDQVGDLASISLTAGDWDVTVNTRFVSNGASWTEAGAGFSSASGNSFTGLTTGLTFISGIWQSSSATPLYVPMAISGRVSIASTTTYYLKYFTSYTSGTPQCQGTIFARRIR